MVPPSFYSRVVVPRATSSRIVTRTSLAFTRYWGGGESHSPFASTSPDSMTHLDALVLEPVRRWCPVHEPPVKVPVFVPTGDEGKGDSSSSMGSRGVTGASDDTSGSSFGSPGS